MNVQIAPHEVEEAFDVVRGPHDELIEVKDHDDDYDRETRQIVPALRRASFRCEHHEVVILLTVYQNKTFRVGRAACGMTLASLAAYARAHEFITRLGLEDAR